MDLSQFEVGLYNFTIYVYDTSGNLTTDSVIIMIVEANSQTTKTTNISTTTPSFYLNFISLQMVIFTIISFTFVLMRKRK